MTSKFDNLQNNLKKKSNISQQEYDYQEVYTQLQLKVLRKRTEITNKILKMEERYVKNGDLSESNEEYKKLCRDINFINKVLRKWNILL